MSFIPKVKMDFVPEETEENEEEELIPEAVPTTEEINPNDIFEETKAPKKESAEALDKEPKKETIIEETIIEEEPPKEPVKKPRKKREYTEEQRQAMRERMAKVREARKIKGKSKKEEESAKALDKQPKPQVIQQPVNRPIQQSTPQPIQQPQVIQPQIMQPQVNQQQAQEAIEKMIFAGIQSYEALRKERKAKKKEAEKKQKEHEDFKNTLKRAMNRKNTNPYGNGFF